MYTKYLNVKIFTNEENKSLIEISSFLHKSNMRKKSIKFLHYSVRAEYFIF